MMLRKPRIIHNFLIFLPVLILLTAVPIYGNVFAKELVAIPYPNLDNLENVVVEQLTKGQKKMSEIINNSEASQKDKAIAYGDLGHLYHAYEFNDAAQACYYNSAILQPNVYRWTYCLAFVLQEKGEYLKAVEYYKMAQSINVTSDLVYLVNIRLGDCYQSLNEIEKAALVFQLAYKIEPEGPAILARMGEVALKQKKYKEAIKYLKAALEKQPAANKLNYPLAMAYRGLKDMKTARIYLAKKGMVGIQPHDPLKKKLDSLVEGYRVHILNGKSAYSAKRYNEAAIAFKKAIKVDPDKPDAFINLGSTYVFLKEYKKAQENYDKAIQIDPENLTAHYNIGDISLHLGDYKKAIKHLTIFLKKNPKDAQAHFNIAEAYKYMRNVQKAFGHYKIAIKIDPDFVKAWVKLSQFLYFNRQDKSSLQVLLEAHLRLPNDFTIMYNLSTILSSSPDLSIRNGKEALKFSQKTYEHLKNFKTAQAIALSYAELNQCDKAKEWMDKAISLVKNITQAELVIKNLNKQRDFYSNKTECRNLATPEK